jgi:glycosyltransferase involved in cell wall biosynthesis
MNQRKILLSIIIPTKNRQAYVLKAVEQIFRLNDQRIQVVIQDNSDETILLEMLSNYNNPIRLKYNYTAGMVSFVDNFSLAISIADGEYVCIIGDDDGIVPQIIDVTEWASKNSIDAVKPELSAVYFWPNSEALGSRTDHGCLSITKITAQARMCNPFNEVVSLLNQGGQNYLSLDMVKLYHGIVRKECLEKIKRQIGKYFGGLSPDIYIAVALSLTVDHVVAIDFPLTISGICNKSGSADAATGRHTGKLEDAPHFLGHQQYEWSDLVPRFYSVETIWADSALAAIKDLNKLAMLNEFNVAALAVYCLKKHPQFKDTIMLHYNNWSQRTGQSKAGIVIAYLKYPIADFIKRVLRRIKRRRGDLVHIDGIENIIAAGEVLQQRFIDTGFDTKSIIALLDKAKNPIVK